MSKLSPLQSLDARRFETPPILKKLASSSRQLAELKGAAASIPNQAILINTLGLQEAKDSSAIENTSRRTTSCSRGTCCRSRAATPLRRRCCDTGRH
jgi:Fic family protein